MTDDIVEAELTAIILALQFVHEKQVQICASAEYRPFFSVTIHTDSKYAVDCLNKWVLKWIQNGWRTSKGGRIIFRWIPRAENGKADKFANDACDEAERDLRETRVVRSGYARVV
ncbi:ribonuclease H-like domain-containing protein [Mycena olivaceomarginata]|nr:ribonuclease H-like domain-containing protein [Mycena olivaceomarginata]